MAFLVHRLRYVTETGRANSGVSTLWRVFDVGGVRTIYSGSFQEMRMFTSLCSQGPSGIRGCHSSMTAKRSSFSHPSAPSTKSLRKIGQ